MVKRAIKRLFLLEFVLDNVAYFELPEKYLKETCVKVVFLENQTFTITENEFETKHEYPTTKEKGVVYFRCGKSCLFSLGPGQLQKSCKLMIYVSKKSKWGSFCQIGSCSLMLGGDFLQLLNRSQPGEEARSATETLSLRDIFNETVGTISLFVRLTYYGTVWVNRSDHGSDDKLSMKDESQKDMKLFPLEKIDSGDEKVLQVVPMASERNWAMYNFTPGKTDLPTLEHFDEKGANTPEYKSIPSISNSQNHQVQLSPPSVKQQSDFVLPANIKQAITSTIGDINQAINAVNLGGVTQINQITAPTLLENTPTFTTSDYNPNFPQSLYNANYTNYNAQSIYEEPNKFYPTSSKGVNYSQVPNIFNNLYYPNQQYVQNQSFQENNNFVNYGLKNVPKTHFQGYNEKNSYNVNQEFYNQLYKLPLYNIANVYPSWPYLQYLNQQGLYPFKQPLNGIFPYPSYDPNVIPIQCLIGNNYSYPDPGIATYDYYNGNNIPNKFFGSNNNNNNNNPYVGIYQPNWPYNYLNYNNNINYKTFNYPKYNKSSPYDSNLGYLTTYLAPQDNQQYPFNYKPFKPKKNKKNANRSNAFKYYQNGYQNNLYNFQNQGYNRNNLYQWNQTTY